MSLKILQEVAKFEIRHRRQEKLSVRIGLHTGPCVAGVVGRRGWGTGWEREQWGGTTSKPGFDRAGQRR